MAQGATYFFVVTFCVVFFSHVRRTKGNGGWVRGHYSLGTGRGREGRAGERGGGARRGPSRQAPGTEGA